MLLCDWRFVTLQVVQNLLGAKTQPLTMRSSNSCVKINNTLRALCARLVACTLWLGAAALCFVQHVQLCARPLVVHFWLDTARRWRSCCTAAAFGLV